MDTGINNINNFNFDNFGMKNFNNSKNPYQLQINSNEKINEEGENSCVDGDTSEVNTENSEADINIDASIKDDETGSYCTIDGTNLDGSLTKPNMRCTLTNFTFVEDKPNPKESDKPEQHTMVIKSADVPILSYIPFFNSSQTLNSLASIQLTEYQEGDKIKVKADINSDYVDDKFIKPAKSFIKDKIEEIKANPTPQTIIKALAITTGAVFALNGVSMLVDKEVNQNVNADIGNFGIGAAVRFGKNDIIKPFGLSFAYHENQKTKLGSLRYGADVSANMTSIIVNTNMNLDFNESSSLSVNFESKNTYNKSFDSSQKITFLFNSHY